jgi:hypothetical protein
MQRNPPFALSPELVEGAKGERSWFDTLTTNAKNYVTVLRPKSTQGSVGLLGDPGS